MVELGGLTIFANVYNILIDLKSELVQNNIQLLKDIKYTEGSQNIMVTCIYHAGGIEHNPSCGISTTKLTRNGKTYEAGTVHCFTCGEQKNLFSFIANCLGSFNESVGKRWLVQKYQSFGETQARPIPELIFEREKRHTVNYKYLDESVLDSYRYTNSYLYSRQFNDDTIAFFEYGYNAMNHTITMPVRDHTGRIVFIKQRYIDPGFGKSKYLNETGIPKQHIIYGLWHLIQFLNAVKEGTIQNQQMLDNFNKYGVTIVEGEFNASYLWQNNFPAISLLGRILFEDKTHKVIKQKELLQRLGLKKGILWMDNDASGISAQKAISDQLNFMKLLKPEVEMFPQYNDANDYLPEHLQELTFKYF